MDEKADTPFWLVWNPQGHPPRYRHPSRSTAQTEAERLARDNPGHEFFVLEPVSVTKRRDVVTRSFQRSKTQPDDDGIPF